MLSPSGHTSRLPDEKGYTLHVPPENRVNEMKKNSKCGFFERLFGRKKKVGPAVTSPKETRKPSKKEVHIHSTTLYQLLLLHVIPTSQLLLGNAL